MLRLPLLRSRYNIHERTYQCVNMVNLLEILELRELC